MNKQTNRREIKVGDVVALKSGSQKMVVVKITHQTADVIWSDFDTKDLKGAGIPTPALIHAS